VLITAPVGARATDLVVWWEKGWYPQEDEAVRETIAAFEQKTGKQVELVQYSQAELAGKINAALEAGQPPDFVFGLDATFSSGQWAYEDRLIDLSDEIMPFASLFDPDALAAATLFDATTGRRALYAVPMGFTTNHVHVWRNLLEQAGFTLEDIPKQWEAFWAFWCDQVQPAVRRATRREDIWGVGLVMSAEETDDTSVQFEQFIQAYDANYVTREGKLVIDDPEIRQRLVKALDSYTAIYRKGCTPPDSLTWADFGNNKSFLEQSVVMTPNLALSVPNALKRERPDDYYKNTATLDWPLGPSGGTFPIEGGMSQAVVFKDGSNVATAKEFVRFLVAEGWLMHYLDFSGERILPSIPALLDSPFWLDPSDPHRMAAAMQASSHPMTHDYTAASGDPGHNRVYNERVWAKAIHRIVTENIAPAQTVDEAIARIKQILAE
jgi:multiple sugar transport system substrate-binding protein